MNEKQRAAFEKWAASKGMSVRRSPYNNNDYTFKATQYCWTGWQAAIASVVVELPCWSEYDTPRQAIEACADRIKDSGVSYE